MSSHQKLSEWQKVASRFTEIVYKSSSEDSRNCRCRFKLFVNLLDSLKQGTTGQLNIYDICWLLQTVHGFADFGGVVEITRLNKSEFLYYLDELCGNELVFAFSFVSSNNTNLETTEQFISLHTRYVCVLVLANFSQKLWNSKKVAFIFSEEC